MKRLSILLLIASLFFCQFSGIPAVNFIISGKPISFYLKCILLAVLTLLFFFNTWKNQFKVDIWKMLFFCGTVFSFIISILNGYSLMDALTEATPFMIPLMLKELIDYSNISIKVLLYSLFITTFIAGVVSVLVATRIIHVNTWAMAGNLIRTARTIDGTCGLVGFTASICLIGDMKNRYNKFVIMLGFVGSILILVFGLSRIRIATALVVLVLFFMTNGAKDNKKYRVFLIVSVLALIVVITNSDIINKVISMIFQRYTTLGQDTSLSTRNEEVKIHLSLLKQSFGLGMGWGFRKFYTEGNIALYVHNTYTGMLMHCGVIFGMIYNVFLFYLTNYFWKEYRVNKSNESMIAFFEMIVLLIMSYSSAGITQTGAWFIMAMVYILRRKDNESRCSHIPSSS